jgi:DNA modification methylase
MAETQLIRADARHLPLDDGTVDLVVTSPPYFALRSYQDGGEHYEGQLGDESTPTEFIDSLVEVTSELCRVVRHDGNIWVNLGDKYQSKGLLGIPWRYAIRCVDELGLILRAEVIWDKPNGLPESCTDRVRRSHEQWFHFVKSPTYYSAIDELRSVTTIYRGLTWKERKDVGNRYSPDNGHGSCSMTANPLGRLPGSVWSIPTEPLTIPDELGIDHFAAFPVEWPRKIISGWSPLERCRQCDSGLRPVIDRHTTGHDNNRRASELGRNIVGSKMDTSQWRRIKAEHPDRIVGYECDCPEPSDDRTTGVVLDPFCGTGTTIAVAKLLGRNAIGTDLSRDYLRLAEWRTNGSGLVNIAKKLDMNTSKPDPNQITLFD